MRGRPALGADERNEPHLAEILLDEGILGTPDDAREVLRARVTVRQHEAATGREAQELAEKNGWTQDAIAFNKLATSWPEILDASRDAGSQVEQATFDLEEA